MDHAENLFDFIAFGKKFLERIRHQNAEISRRSRSIPQAELGINLLSFLFKYCFPYGLFLGWPTHRLVIRAAQERVLLLFKEKKKKISNQELLAFALLSALFS